MRALTSSLSLVLVSTLSLAAIGCVSGDATDSTDDDASSVGKVALWQSSDSQWHFHVQSGNGAILLTSESYTSRTAAIAGLLSTESNGVDPAEYQVVPAAHGYLLHLVAANNEIIGTTQVYATKASATRAITSCTNAVLSYLDHRQGLESGARLDIETGATGGLHFNFIAANGQVVLTSQDYANEAAALDGALAVQSAPALAYTVQPNIAGGYFFHVTAANGQIIGTSQQYTTKESAVAGVAATEKLVPTISVL